MPFQTFSILLLTIIVSTVLHICIYLNSLQTGYIFNTFQ